MAKGRKDSKGRVLRKGECQRKDGRYIFQYINFNGKRTVIYDKDLVKLRKKEDEIERDRLDGINTRDAVEITLNSSFDKFISTRFNLKERSRITYESNYNLYVKEEIGDRKIAKIKYTDIKYFYNSLINKGISINTIRLVNAVLNQIFNMEIRDELIRSNPTKGVIGEMRKEHDAGKRRALSMEQQRAFLNYVRSNPEYASIGNLFEVLFGTGCRISELIGLRWEDIDYKTGVISINHAISYYPNKKGITEPHISSLKTQYAYRDIPMMKRVREAFQNEYAIQEMIGFNKESVGKTKGFVFRNRDGNILRGDSINRRIKKIYSDYNKEELVNAAKENRKPIMIPNFTCHHIRHTFCTRLCENDINIKAIQTIMGHSNIKVTMDIYAEVGLKKIQDEMEKLELNDCVF